MTCAGGREAADQRANDVGYEFGSSHRGFFASIRLIPCEVAPPAPPGAPSWKKTAKGV